MVVDDEPIARKILAEYIAEVDLLEWAGEATNPLEAMPLLAGDRIDLLFLDIQMPRFNGLDFLRTARNRPAVILTTAHAEYALDAFGLDVIDYLLKPIPFERFVAACQRALERSKPAAPPAITTLAEPYFFVKCDGRMEKVLFDELLYAEALMNYVVLHTTQGKLVVYMTIKLLEEQLPAERFVKVHKSYIVNIGKIRSIEGGLIQLGSAQVPLSQGLRESVLARIVGQHLLRR